MAEMTISKSQYMKGLQCPKALWFYRHRKDLKPEVTPEQQALFDTGDMIGKLAMRYFGEGGVEVDNEYWDVSGAIEATNSLVKKGETLIFEATAKHPVDGGYSRIDILKKVDETDFWDLIEVKSSTEVKDYHIDDMAFQYHVFYGAGYKIRKCFMLVLDNSYVRQGEIDPSRIFKLEDISDLVFSKQAEVEAVAGQLGYILQRPKEPDVRIGARCFAPFECEYKAHCWQNVPDYSVFNIFRKQKAEEIMHTHGADLESLPENLWPAGNKFIDLRSYFSRDILVDKANIRAFLKQLEYPLYFLDYETIMPSLPLFDGTRPFQQLPFQFSVHIQKEEGAELTHLEYLHKDTSDPRRNFAEKLIEYCGDSGTVVVYNQAFEIARNKELARDFPVLSDAITSINARVIDLLIPFRSRWLYNPVQKGSASIKAVLPAFTELSYDELAISNGGQAMQQYGDFMAGRFSEDLWPDLWKNLTEYCKQDTYAMVLLLDVLKRYGSADE